MGGSSPRKKNRCNKCPGRPFKTQCSCTVAGRKYLERRAIQPPQIMDSAVQSVQPLDEMGTLPLNKDAAAGNSRSSTPSSDDGDQGDQGDGSPPSKKRPAEGFLETPGIKRVRVSTANAVYGFVEGAGRGNQTDIKIPRSSPLRPPLAGAQDISKRFYRVMRDVITRCERLSVETGCWLYIAGQHVSATEPFLWYGSPRLVNEGLNDLNDVHGSMGNLLTSLVAARRNDALDLAKQLKEANERHESENQSNLAEIAKRDMLITYLQSQASSELSQIPAS